MGRKGTRVNKGHMELQESANVAACYLNLPFLWESPAATLQRILPSSLTRSYLMTVDTTTHRRGSSSARTRVYIIFPMTLHWPTNIWLSAWCRMVSFASKPLMQTQETMTSLLGRLWCTWTQRMRCGWRYSSMTRTVYLQTQAGPTAYSLASSSMQTQTTLMHWQQTTHRIQKTWKKNCGSLLLLHTVWGIVKIYFFTNACTASYIITQIRRPTYRFEIILFNKGWKRLSFRPIMSGKNSLIINNLK